MTPRVIGLLGCSFVLAPLMAGALVLDALVARIDNEVITWSQVVQERQLLQLGGAPSQELTPTAVRETLVRRHLLVSEARKLRLEVSASEAQQELTELARTAGGADFWNLAARLGLDRAKLDERAAQQLLVGRYQQLRREMTFVPEANVRAFFLAQTNLPADTSLAVMRDEIRAHLADQRYQEELERWIKRQIAEGRVEWLPLPDEAAN